MAYVACEVVTGEAQVVADEGLVEFAWSTHGRLPEYVPYGLFSAGQDHLDTALKS